MVISTLRICVQNKLQEVANEGVYYPVTYSRDADHTATMIEGSPMLPSSVTTNEVSASFNVAELNRRSSRQDRADWIFELNLTFDQEVTLEKFEESWFASPPRIPRSVENGNRQISLSLLDAEYEHPPQQQSSTGTRAKYRVEAVLSPA